MFGWFKRKDARIGLQEKYKALLAESHRLSTSNRKASDLKRAEAEAVLKRLEAMGDEH